MALKKITTPRGSILQTANGKAQLQWNPSFAARRNESFSRKQKYVDSEVLRRCSPRVPIDTGIAQWFERMKTEEKDDILRGAEKI